MYRDYDDAYWEFDNSRNVNPNEWTDWDIILAAILQLIEDYTDTSSGQLMWYDQSDEVDWELGSLFSGSQAALEADDSALEPGETRYAKPVFKEGKKKPTIHDWIKQLEEDSAHPHGSPNNGHNTLDIMDARDEKERKRKELAEKLRNGDLIE